MAGHSKWANIKHRKERSDAKKGKIFPRVTKEIISAVKQGGEDYRANPRLRVAIQKAKEVNMPNENIERNIKKASSQDQADFSAITYELYGHGGVGLIVDVLTDNKNRISSDMRIATNKRGGTVAAPGSVSFNFDRKGVLHIAKEGHDEDTLFLLSGEVGAEDFQSDGEEFLIITPLEEMIAVKEKVEAAGVAILEANLEMIPKVKVECDEETAKANLALIEWLEELDDVDAVYHNME